ncbi:retrovirus-related pol polyprotein from transposon TNT 1-94 [Tanacetum coccineum]
MFLHHTHANSSYSPQSYYVTHPPSVIDYDDEYQGRYKGILRGQSLEPLYVILRAILKIVQRVPRTDSTPSKANVQCYNCNEKGHFARDCQKPKFREAKYFREQMLLAMKDEAGSHLNNKENDFMLDNAYGEESLDELTASVMLIARLQPADGNTDTVPSYDEKAVSQVHDSSKAHEVSHVKRKTIIQTTDDDQIDSSIIFDDPYVDNNGGTSKHDSIAHEEYHEIQMLAYNVQREAENEKRLNIDLKKQKDLLQQKLETFKDRVKTFESQTVQCSKYKESCDDLEPKKAFKERENRYLEDIVDLEEKLSSHDRIVYNMGQILDVSIRPFVAQPKMYDEDMLHSDKLIIDSPDSEETLDDAEESDAITGLHTRINKTLLQDAKRRWLSDSQNKLKEFYKTDVIPMSRSLYKNLKEIKEELIEEVQEMLNIFESMKQKVNEKSPTKILLQNEIDRLLEVSLTSEIRECVLLSAAQQKHELLKDELEKSSSDSKEIQANLLNRIKILEHDFQRSQTQSIDFELKLQHQKEKMACDVFWKSKLSTLNSENVFLKSQVESVVQEQENIKLEFQKLFNSIKVTWAQHQKEVDDMIKCVNQKMYAYGDVRAKNQDLLMTISELKNKLRTIEKGKNVNTKFDSSETLRKRVCVTPFNKNIADKAMNASNTKVNSDRSKPVTSQSTPKPEQGVGSSHSVRRSTSKDNKSKNSILKNTKSSSIYVWKTLNSDCLDSNKSETKTSNVCQTNACISNSKTVKACVNVVNDGSNIVCISCGNDVFLHSHEKCVARHALSRKSSVKRALFTSPLATQSKNLGATSIVTKSRLSVAKTPIATHKVSSALTLSSDSRDPTCLWIVDSGCSKHMTSNLQLLRNFVEKFMGTVCFGNDHFAAIT